MYILYKNTILIYIYTILIYIYYMKLYEVPRNNKILVDGETFLFKHIDGMYSYCLDKNNDVVHLAAWLEVEVLPEGD